MFHLERSFERSWLHCVGDRNIWQTLVGSDDRVAGFLDKLSNSKAQSGTYGIESLNAYGPCLGTGTGANVPFGKLKVYIISIALSHWLSIPLQAYVSFVRSV